MIVSDPVLQVACAALVLLVPLGLSLMLPGSRAVSVAAIVAGVGGFVTAMTGHVVVSTTIDLSSMVFDASGAGAFASSVVLLIAPKCGARASTVIAVLWSVLVYQPVFWATVTAVPSLSQTVFGAVDFSAVFATHVSSAAVVAVVASTPRRAARGPGEPAAESWGRAALAAVLVTCGASAWMLGLERVLSDSSGRIALNAAGGLVLGALVCLLISQIAGRSVRPRGLVAGVICAWGALGTGVAFLSPAALIASVVLGTAAGTAVVVRAGERANPLRRRAIGIVVAVVVGGTVLAILADGFGMSATGSVALVAGQIGAVIAVLAYSVGVALLIWLVSKVAARRQHGRREGEWWAIPDSN